MAQRVCTYAYELIALDKVKKNKEKLNRIIDDGGLDLVRCICDCVLNVLRGIIPVKDEEKQRLKKYKDCLRELVKKKTSDKKRQAYHAGRRISRSTHPYTCGFSRKTVY